MRCLEAGRLVPTAAALCTRARGMASACGLTAGACSLPSRPGLSGHAGTDARRSLSCFLRPVRASSQHTGDAASAEETIVALSSGTQRSAVAVIRISGPKAEPALLSMLRPDSTLPEPRAAALRTLYDPVSRRPLDKALVLRFPAPSSFTGEDVVEVQGHGGPAVVRALLAAITTLPGVRLAEAGEFTRRAFVGGKLDLTEVEGIADLLAAETAAQHQQALQQTSGLQRRQYEAWRRTLLKCLAHVEAVIDFGDDNDIDSGVAAEILPAAVNLRRELELHLSQAKRGELVRDGVRVALVGPPNAGKSTILNSLAGREAAIVSPIPGTTRDAIEVVLELGGQKVIVADTAGLRETEDAVEAEGVSRARRAAAAANIVVAVADVTSPGHDRQLADVLAGLTTSREGQAGSAQDDSGVGPWLPQRRLSEGWSEGHEGVAQSTDLGLEPSTSRLRDRPEATAKPLVLVFNKCDLVPCPPFEARADQEEHMPPEIVGRVQALLSGDEESRLYGSATAAAPGRAMEAGPEILGISASTGKGSQMLLEVLERRVAGVLGDEELPEGLMITRLRHRQHVEECVEALKGYEAVASELELASEELRFAAKALGRVTGAIDIEHVLDAVFSEFCVGK